MSTVSIIVPAYNVEKYLREALQSIIDQTYHDLQIICIDDGSTDESAAILHEIAVTDPRVEVYTQANQGCSAARNLALQKVRGEYLMFVDADDWLDADACERAVSLMEEEAADLVLWAYRKEYETHSEEVKVLQQKKVFAPSNMPKLRRRILGLTAEEMSHPELMDSIGTLWGKLYRSKIFIENHIQFVDLDEIGSAEDVLANLYYTAYASKAVYIPDCLYHYRKTNVGSQTRHYRPRLQNQWQHLFKRMEEWRGQFDDSEASRAVLDNRIAYALVGLGLNELNSDKTYWKNFTYIKQLLHADWYRRAVSRLDLSHMPPHWKVFFYFAKHRLTLFTYLVLLVIKTVLRKG